MHKDLNQKVTYNGITCRIIGVTYSHPEYRGNKQFYSYHLMPEGKRSLKDSIQYQTVDKLAFEPPKSNLSELERDREGDAHNMPDVPSTASPAYQFDENLGGFICKSKTLELVKG